MKNVIFALALVFATLNTSAQYTKLHDFNSVPDGATPQGNLISDGTFLYGVTSKGGAINGGVNNRGTIFKIKPDGTGYAKLFDFDGPVNGSSPLGSLFFDGTFLYGMTNSGGTNGDGTMFKILPDGTGFVKLLDFLLTFNGPTGSSPLGSLISDGTFLYGMTNGGGTSNDGIIFKIKPDGTGYVKLLDFDEPTTGRSPTGSLIFDGTFLYGMTNGGSTDCGTIFKIKPDGTGFAKLYDFVSNPDGCTPFGSLISDGTFLYGMTWGDGTNLNGTIFKIMTNGTGYAKLLDFTGTPDGGRPFGSLIFDGVFLYGMTSLGGTNDLGTIFKIKPDGTGYARLLDFDGTANGSRPQGSLISDGTFLYGMTAYGGTKSSGTIFKFQDISTSIADNNMQSSFNVFPNPSNGKFTIKNNGLGIPNYKLEIYNVIGEKVYAMDTFHNQTSYDIDLSNSPKGVYFAKMYEGQTILTKIIVLQ
ncbi:MAG: T9SS C-terminal target domain-containing protein [Bacteroidetes bacterium]|nr:MAG: T9SS C-terminal target domain-containing protein [Bacteroidota bacterium]